MTNRELDRRIAEAIEPEPTGGWYDRLDECAWWHWDQVSNRWQPKPFSTDANLALRAAQALCKKHGWRLTMEYHPCASEGEWAAYACEGEHDQPLGADVCDDSFPLALCRALVGALEGDQAPAGRGEETA